MNCTLYGFAAEDASVVQILAKSDFRSFLFVSLERIVLAIYMIIHQFSRVKTQVDD